MFSLCPKAASSSWEWLLPFRSTVCSCCPVKFKSWDQEGWQPKWKSTSIPPCGLFGNVSGFMGMLRFLSHGLFSCLTHFSTWVRSICGGSDHIGTEAASYFSLIDKEDDVERSAQEATENVWVPVFSASIHIHNWSSTSPLLLHRLQVEILKDSASATEWGHRPCFSTQWWSAFIADLQMFTSTFFPPWKFQGSSQSVWPAYIL